jgi:4-hydroxybenzoate polyprenyltransferase
VKSLATWIRAVRVHQWAKNGLILLPALAAHLGPDPDTVARLAGAFVSFSLLASAVYLLNDMVDLEHDRAHPVKRKRPLAAGEIGRGAALVGMAGAAVLSLLLALRLPGGFLQAWLAYLVVTTAYSFWLKRVVVLDVVVLAALYTVRVVAGAAAVTVPLSRWFLAFSIFLFLSLALLKRFVETLGTSSPGAGSEASDDDGEATNLAGRGWESRDGPVLMGLGTASAVASALVYCLYISGGEVSSLYARPDVLWLGLPVLLYWLGRVWLLAGRGEVHDDPLLFALRDAASYAVLLVLGLTVGLAL